MPTTASLLGDDGNARAAERWPDTGARLLLDPPVASTWLAAVPTLRTAEKHGLLSTSAAIVGDLHRAPLADVSTGQTADRPGRLDQETFNALTREAPRCGLTQIRDAIDRADYDDAAIRALVRAKLALELPADLVADLLVGVHVPTVFLALIRHTTGELVEPLLELLRRGRFGWHIAGATQTALVAFAVWNLQPGEASRVALLPDLRRLARSLWLPSPAHGLVAWLTGCLDDPHLTAIYNERLAKMPCRRAGGMGKIATDAWHASVDEIVALLPEHVPDVVLPDAPIHVAPKLGRNERCPCGSGKKVKRCCASAPTNHAVPELSRAEQLRALEPHLVREQIAQLSRADLAQLDLRRLRESAVLDVVRRQACLHDWTRASLATEEVARRHGRVEADHVRHQVAHDAASAGHLEVAAGLVSLQADDVSLRLRLTLALAARTPAAFDDLEAAARAAIEHDSMLTAIELSQALLRAMPALGILVARGAIVEGDPIDTAMLQNSVEEARDRLLLRPGDPGLQVGETLRAAQADRAAAANAEAERARLAETTEALRARLHEATTRGAEFQRAAEHNQRELARAKRTLTTVDPHGDASVHEEVQRLRDKSARQQAIIRSGHAERVGLRRQLSRVTARADNAAMPVQGSRRPCTATENAADGEIVPPETSLRPVLVPQFGAEVVSALASVPRNVAAEAMRTIGSLAAGDAAVWRRVKQAKDMPRPVLMARIGIHHRLVFGVDGGTLAVGDLVARGSLLATLKRMRSS